MKHGKREKKEWVKEQNQKIVNLPSPYREKKGKNSRVRCAEVKLMMCDHHLRGCEDLPLTYHTAPDHIIPFPIGRLLLRLQSYLVMWRIGWRRWRCKHDRRLFVRLRKCIGSNLGQVEDVFKCNAGTHYSTVRLNRRRFRSIPSPFIRVSSCWPAVGASRHPVRP